MLNFFRRRIFTKVVYIPITMVEQAIPSENDVICGDSSTDIG